MAQRSSAALFLLVAIVTLLLLALPATATQLGQDLATQLGIPKDHAVVERFVQCNGKIELNDGETLRLKLDRSAAVGVVVECYPAFDREPVLFHAIVASENYGDQKVDVVVIQTTGHRLEITFAAGRITVKISAHYWETSFSNNARATEITNLLIPPESAESVIPPPFREAVMRHLLNERCMFPDGTCNNGITDSGRIQLYAYGGKLFAWRDEAGGWARVKTPATVIDSGERKTIRIDSIGGTGWLKYDAVFTQDKGQQLVFTAMITSIACRGKRIAEVLFGPEDVKSIDKFIQVHRELRERFPATQTSQFVTLMDGQEPGKLIAVLW
eukprot:GHVS01002896.1.p1 GENE.GHVS01002896.1~~GHVS01002896.1.p1  ORF type:complete len:328 (+),score=23.19 GHVS01002896.1:232-1215(+)